MGVAIHGQSCFKCGVTTEIRVIDGIEFCMRCHPDLDPGRKLFVMPTGDVKDMFYESELAREIDLAAEAAGINPATGEHFTLDEIIDRNKAVPTASRPKDTVKGSLGNCLEVPPECPIPGFLIKSTWCDFADGWHITLINKVTFQEQPGPAARSVEHSIGYHSYEPGWHVFEESGPKILSVRSYESAYPGTDALQQAWLNYRNHLKATDVCHECLGIGQIRYRNTMYPCHQCNTQPPIESGSVHVPTWFARCPDTALEDGTWWRYRGEDMVVWTFIEDRDNEGRGWVYLRAPTPKDADALDRAHETTMVWVDDYEDNSLPSRVGWMASRQALDVFQSWPVRAWRRGYWQRAFKWSVALGAIYAAGTIVGSML